MGRVVIFLVLSALLGASPQPPPAPSKPEGKVSAPVLSRTFALDGVRGPSDRTGIAGRIDHMAYDPATKRLFIACVANGSLEVIDLDAGKRIGTIDKLPEPQGVAVAGGFVYVATGGDGRVSRFETGVPKSARSAAVGDDADNVRVARDGKIWVSFGGEGPGGLASFDGDTMQPGLKLGLPRMPEGFQLHPTDDAIFANVPAGKRSAADGTVFGLKRLDR